jgi:hypothetical protein
MVAAMIGGVAEEGLGEVEAVGSVEEVGGEAAVAGMAAGGRITTTLRTVIAWRC